MTAEAALAGIHLVFIAVVVVGEIGLGQCSIKLTVVLLYKLLGTNMTCIHRAFGVVCLEAGSDVAHQFRVGCKIGRDEVAVLLFGQRSVMQAKFEVADFAGLAVARSEERRAGKE